jgi:hypothetical protein
MAFHLRNGLFFERKPDGHVRIYVTSDQRFEEQGGNVVFDLTVSPDEFASVMAAMSARGEGADTFTAARHFLEVPLPA